MNEIENAIDKDNLAEAEQLCEKILEQNEYDLTGLFYKAIINRKLKNYQVAIDTHNTLINLLPSNADYYAERGLTFHMLEDKSQAMQDFNRAVELEPENGYRYASRAFVRDFYGDHYGAVNDYNKAIELDPEDAVSLNNLGVIEEKLGRLEQAMENFDRSDKITGVDQKLKEATSVVQSDKTKKPAVSPAKSSGFKNFYQTLKAMFTSSRERRLFIRFLLGKK